jgi:dihydrofolate reductase
MDISMIVAVAEEGVIGLDGGIPWHISEDMRYFKKTTMGKPIIMGRKTWESMGRPLPGRLNIVVSTQLPISTEGAVVVRDLDSALKAADGADEVMIIGGAGLYEQGLAVAQRVYLTEVHARYDGDTIFPPIDPALWKEVSREAPQDRKPTDPDYSFVIYERQA